MERKTLFASLVIISIALLMVYVFLVPKLRGDDKPLVCYRFTSYLEDAVPCRVRSRNEEFTNIVVKLIEIRQKTDKTFLVLGINSDDETLGLKIKAQLGTNNVDNTVSLVKLFNDDLDADKEKDVYEYVPVDDAVERIREIDELYVQLYKFSDLKYRCSQETTLALEKYLSNPTKDNLSDYLDRGKSCPLIIAQVYY